MTLPAGKDAPLAQSISYMQTQLAQLGFEIEEAHWLNPVPDVWSVHIHDRHCPLLFTNGKGASRDAALASALGEFFERLSCNYFFADYYLGNHYVNQNFVHYPQERWFAIEDNQLPPGLLDEPSLLHYNIHDELTAPLLVDTNSGNPARGICALPFVRQKNGKTVWFPVNIIGNLYVSNGMSAGNTQWEARVQALSEIFERHIKSTILSSGITLPRIPQRIIDCHPKSANAIQTLRDKGFVIVVNDASLGGKFPLVNVTLLNPEDGGCYAAFGAHPKFEVALERTVTELLQGRALDQLNDFPAPSFDIAEVADPQNLETHFIDSSGITAWDLLSDAPDYDFTEWNIEGDSEAEFHHLCHLIHRVDMDIYIADYEHLGFYSCRIIVPGMSEIYPLDDLVWHNNNAGMCIRDYCLRLGSLSPKACRLLLEQLDEQGFDDQQRIAELIGIAADNGSAFETLRVGELRCLLALALGDLESALEWSDWTLDYNQLHPVRQRLHRCLNQCLNFALDNDRPLEQYRPVLEELHGKARLARCMAMLAGETLFNEFPNDDGSLDQFGNHSALLKAYERLHQAKQAHC
ncbi:MAG: 30S ribosomal protein S12 methylthiotransferase accessory factor YcaO [Marinobacterium sp.]|nr:30S ribosomal protein S12 methylthiotransferase accessory factor YcaO [Marinobacterium sp.]